ncbi:D-cysteine desulfhydrase family protein [Microbacterium gilvum]|uniref:D-cysteine desulfhydrase n=1 Tax=Microbacterium gilvum TaxID=1336204 RepID=A0ABP9A2Y9_9MICO
MSADALLDPLFLDAVDPAVRDLRTLREDLVTAPTPLQPLDRLRAELGGGPRLWVKRDDLTGLALGGNKARKLEYLLADARAQRADVLVTVGAAQSNHARQTAAAAAKAGLEAVLVLRVPPGSTPEYTGSGNVLLDRILGAQVVLVEETSDDPHPERAAADAVVAQLRADGLRPYLIPSGGSTPVGALGYLESYAEIAASEQRFTEIVVATGSAGTQAGLVAAQALLGGDARIHGVAVSPDVAELAEAVDTISAGTLAFFGRGPADDAWVDGAHVGAAYGALTEGGVEAIRLFARTEGILLDPVYTGKAAAALIAGVRSGAYGEDDDVLFVHTGGSPALFAHAPALGEAFAG